MGAHVPAGDDPFCVTFVDLSREVDCEGSRLGYCSASRAAALSLVATVAGCHGRPIVPNSCHHDRWNALRGKARNITSVGCAGPITRRWWGPLCCEGHQSSLVLRRAVVEAPQARQLPIFGRVTGSQGPLTISSLRQ